VRFKRLKLTGFKSFVDPTELLIQPGVTGVVGPNGCGKSNLVEALKWVMGETSAKQMRGGEMDDVIFGGSQSRPARNVAEVLIELDNTDRTAPAIFNDSDELQVTRRINRGQGSNYKVNGKDSRARDVQLLFADAATGARSTALVSQGRIGALIAAKPTDRRSLLEEAAGITGLHSRRHEAELRLRGAETNLERLEDVIATIETQLQGLKRQARQATRYRNISDQIRKAEATVMHLRWTLASENLDKARATFGELRNTVNDLTAAVAGASTKQTTAAALLPDLRQEEAAAAAVVQRLTLERERLDADEKRVSVARSETENRIAQISRDAEREQELSRDAAAAIERLTAEAATIEEARSGEAEAQEAARKSVEENREKVTAQETALDGLTTRLANEEAQRVETNRRIADLENRLRRASTRLEETEKQIAAVEADAVAAGQLEDSENAEKTAGDAVSAAREALEAAGEGREKAEAARAAAVELLQEVNAEMAGLQAEEKALNQVLGSDDDDLFPPLIDAVTVPKGMETALGAAIEELELPLDEAAPKHWRTLPVYGDAPPLPSGAEPLARGVGAPDALARRLSQIGLVPDSATGDRLQGDLRPGQRLVTKDGALWRWDGYRVRADAPTAAAIRLQQRNRLKELRAQIAESAKRQEAAAQAAEQAKEAAAGALADEQAARQQLRNCEQDLDIARTTAARLREKAAATTTRLDALRETAATLQTERNEISTALEAARDAQAKMTDGAALQEEANRLRADLAEARNALLEAQSSLESLLREAADRRRRLDSIAAERKSWSDRAEGAGARLKELSEREAEAKKRLEEISSQPGEINDKRRALSGQLEQAEVKRKDVADRLAVAETGLSEADKQLRQVEAALSEARELRARAEASVEHGDSELRDLARQIRERLETGPQNLPRIAELESGKPLPSMEDAERKFERLQRERDNMGPVNLRAEQEATELTEQMETMLSEREDLTRAIAKLRQGIAALNKEGRERLLASFEIVDRNFQELFTRLFGGGRAHLSLTESEDPLNAGLEIMASPPGKRLQALSLLSGGEQALTAIALLFGVFLTNPAPICVLDEVDAPLDDANVDRFCRLVEEIAKSSNTRFLVVTHHRMTMARVDRLFGVTMGERGVSQLVSVDLQTAEKLRDAG
jgi:chromosome segregation protein